MPRSSNRAENGESAGVKVFYGWYVLAVAMVFQAITFGLGNYSFTFWIEPWTQEFQAGRADVSLAIMLFTMSLGVLGPLAGWAFDRFSLRLLICLGGIVYAAGLLLLSLATALWQIVVLYAVVLGMGFTLAGSIAGQTLAAKWFRRNRGLAIGIVSTGSSVGGFLLPPLVAWLIVDFDWRTAQRILAAITFVAIVPLTWLIVANRPEDKGVEPEPESERASGSARSDQRTWRYGEILRERTFWIIVAGILPPALAFAGLLTHLRPYTNDVGLEPQQTALAMSALAIAMIASKLLVGALADRVDLRFIYWGVAAPLITAMAVMSAAEPGYAALMVLVPMIGFSGGSHMALMGAMVGARFGPASFGRVIGLLMPFLTLSATGAYISGWVRDTLHSYQPTFIAYASLAVGAAIAIYFLPTRAKKEERIDP
jgi:MFS family permease